MKTANELRIRDEEYEALKWVREELATNAIVWQNRSGEWIEWSSAPKQFNMGTILSRDEGFGGCKTAACVGGWMAIRMGHTERWDAVNYVNNEMSPALVPLCFPYPSLMEHMRPEHAVKAIDNFLETGDPAWEQVMGVVPVPRVSHSVSDHYSGPDHELEFAGDRLQSNRVVDLGSRQRRLAYAGQETLEGVRREQLRLPSKVSEQG
jgi:hypothetical protein